MQEFLTLAALITFVVTVTGLLLSGVIHAAVTAGPLRGRPASFVGSSDHSDGAVGPVDDRVADRAEKHPLVGAPTAGSDDHQPGVFRGVHEGHFGRAVLDARRHRQIRVIPADASCREGSDPVRRGSQLGLVDVLDLVPAGAGDHLEGR